MTRGPEHIAFSATAAGVMLATGAAFTLIIYALVALAALFLGAPIQELAGRIY
jgi:hypothetical protein